MYAALMRRVDVILAKVEVTFAAIAGIALFAAMILVTLDALMRHFLARPLGFQLTLTQDYLLVALVLMALPWGWRTGGFIRIDALVRELPGVAGQILLRTGLLLSFLYVADLAWLGGARFLRAWTSGEVELGVINWPVDWSWIWVPLGLGLLALRLAVDLLSPRWLPVESGDQEHDE